MRPSLTTTLNDADSEYSNTLQVRVTANDSVISIFPAGYGDFGSAPGYGCPIFLELYQGRLRLIVFPDINNQEPTIIDLEAAREDQHVPCDEGTPGSSVRVTKRVAAVSPSENPVFHAFSAFPKRRRNGCNQFVVLDETKRMSQ